MELREGEREEEREGKGKRSEVGGRDEKLGMADMAMAMAIYMSQITASPLAVTLTGMK